MEESYEYFKTGLQIKRSTNANDKSLCISIKNVAISLSDKGQHAEGLTMLKEAYALLDKHPGYYYEIRSNVCVVEGQILLRLKNFDRAIKTIIASIAIRDQYALNRVCNCECYLTIANAYIAKNRKKDALIWLGKVYKEREVIASENPTCTFVLDSCQVALEVYSSLNDTEHIVTTLNNTNVEIDRLLQVFTDLGNKNKKRELEIILKRLQDQYEIVKVS